MVAQTLVAELSASTCQARFDGSIDARDRLQGLRGKNTWHSSASTANQMPNMTSVIFDMTITLCFVRGTVDNAELTMQLFPPV
jgi:hypothetical protein